MLVYPNIYNLPPEISLASITFPSAMTKSGYLVVLLMTFNHVSQTLHMLIHGLYNNLV